MERITQAIILAAGEGQRLRPFTAVMPKVMLRIADKPILQYVIEALTENGIRRIVMVVGYRRDHVQDYFGSGQNFGVEIEYVIQSQQLGVGHAIKQAEAQADERFMVIMGDNMIDPETIETLAQAPGATILTKTIEDSSRYKSVLIREGKVNNIITPSSETSSGPIDVGAYVFTKKIFQYIGDEVRLTPILRKMLADGNDIAALQTEGFWQDAVYPWDLLKLNDSRLSKISPSLGGTVEEGVQIKGPVAIGDGTVIRSNSYIVGPVIIGENCEIGPNTCLFPSTSVGNGTVISPFTVIRNSSIGNNVTIGPGASISNSLFASGTSIGSHFSALSSECTMRIENEYYPADMGAIIGHYSKLGDNVIVEPGMIVGNNCRINPLKLIDQNIPDNGLVI